jgi:hypothetical protein
VNYRTLALVAKRTRRLSTRGFTATSARFRSPHVSTWGSRNREQNKPVSPDEQVIPAPYRRARSAGLRLDLKAAFPAPDNEGARRLRRRRRASSAVPVRISTDRRRHPCARHCVGADPASRRSRPSPFRRDLRSTHVRSAGQRAWRPCCDFTADAVFEAFDGPCVSRLA